MDVQGALARGRRVYLVDLLWRAAERYSRSEVAIYATAVSYRMLLSLFPLLIVFVAVFGLLTALPGVGSWLGRMAVDQVPGEDLKRLVESVSGVSVAANGAAGVAGLVALVLSASGMFGTLRQALNRAFGVPAGPAYVRARALDVAGVGGLFLLGLLAIGLSAALGALGGLVGRLAGGWPGDLARATVDRVLPYAMSMLTLLLLYRLLPNHTLGVRDLWPGALFAGTGLELAKVGFGFYLAWFSRYDVVYGALAGAVALLVFLFLVATIILFAAGLVAERARDRLPQPGRR